MSSHLPYVDSLISDFYETKHGLIDYVSYLKQKQATLAEWMKLVMFLRSKARFVIPQLKDEKTGKIEIDTKEAKLIVERCRFIGQDVVPSVIKAAGPLIDSIITEISRIEEAVKLRSGMTPLELLCEEELKKHPGKKIELILLEA